MSADAEVASVSPWSAEHGIQQDGESGHYWCGLCSTAASLERNWERVIVKMLGPDPEDVVDHLLSTEHISVLEVHVLQITEFLPVTINGLSMLLDHHCIFPRTMFGAGCSVYDQTLGMLLTVDICGAVRLFPHHAYVVSRCLPPSHSTTLKELDANKEHNWMVARDQRQLKGSGAMGTASVPLGPSQQRLLRFRIAALREARFRGGTLQRRKR